MNAAPRRVIAFARNDNLKIGPGNWAGPLGEVNEGYRTHARSVGFQVDA